FGRFVWALSLTSLAFRGSLTARSRPDGIIEQLLITYLLDLRCAGSAQARQGDRRGHQGAAGQGVSRRHHDEFTDIMEKSLLATGRKDVGAPLVAKVSRAGILPERMADKLWEPLCYAQIGGLTAATFITLLLV